MKNLPYASANGRQAALLLVMLPLYLCHGVLVAHCARWHGMRATTQLFCPRLGGSNGCLLSVVVAVELSNVGAECGGDTAAILYIMRMWPCWWHSLIAAGMMYTRRSRHAAAAHARHWTASLYFGTLTHNTCWQQAAAAAVCYTGSCGQRRVAQLNRSEGDVGKIQRQGGSSGVAANRATVGVVVSGVDGQCNDSGATYESVATAARA